MSEGPYRTPAEVEKERKSFLERVASNKVATGATGLLTIFGAYAALVLLVELPGLAVLYGELAFRGKPLGKDWYIVAPFVTGLIAVVGYFGYKIIHGFLEVALEVGSDVLGWLTKRS